jgi:hypothetical protein
VGWGRSIGAGGTRLHGDVAIKVLPLLEDVDGWRRCASIVRHARLRPSITRTSARSTTSVVRREGHAESCFLWLVEKKGRIIAAPPFDSLRRSTLPTRRDLTGFWHRPANQPTQYAQGCCSRRRERRTNDLEFSNGQRSCGRNQTASSVVERQKASCYNGGMTNTFSALARLSDAAVLDDARRLAQQERGATAALIASLSEVDERRLYLGEGSSSLFTYFTQVLRLSEHAAYRRIEAARAARRFPVLLDLLERGAINLTTVGLLTSHLTAANHRTVLDAAAHKSKREVEQLVASLRPREPVPSIIRKLPAAKRALGQEANVTDASGSAAAIITAGPPRTVPVPARPPAPARCPAVVAPLAPNVYRLQITLSQDAHDKLRRAQDLLRHTIPSGDPAALVERALTLLVTTLETQKLAATSCPRQLRSGPAAASRTVPASVRRQVWARDRGRCAFLGKNGRCGERGFLEFHHVVPFAAGGAATVENIELRCRAHNAYEAELFFGPLIAREASVYYSSSVRTELSSWHSNAHNITPPRALSAGQLQATGGSQTVCSQVRLPADRRGRSTGGSYQ